MRNASLPLLCTAALAWAAAAQADSPPHYHLTHEVPLPGDDGWDYLAYDSAGGRIFVTHGTKVQAVDSGKLILTGEIGDTPGVHGVAFAHDLGRGYISAGRANTVVVFDLKTLTVIARIPTGENPDAILYEPTTHRVFTFNGRSRNISAIDTAKNEVIGTIPVDAKPEFAATDGAGHVFVNLEDKSSIASIDPIKLTVTAVWPLSGCEEPSGLAIDVKHRRLFSVCDKAMAVVDSGTGRVVANVPIGSGIDAAAYDPGTRLAFASGGDGTLTVVQEETPDKFAVVQTVQTRAGARTMALDDRTHRVFLVTAKFGPRPAPTAEQPHPRPSIVPRSFELLVLDP
ncbi:MAG TPA: YncE family protein [Steroidobacteraceae bacterium]|nr:YncE family protein [Steroidobacteraceae bacterium]